MTENRAAPSRRSRWKIFGVVALVTLVAYTLAGFFLLPWLAARQLVGFVEQTLGRRAAVERIRFNPYTFELSVERFSTTEPEGAPLLAIEQLYVDFELSSVFRGPWTLGEIRLSRPSTNFVRFPDGGTNIGRALDPLLGGEAPPDEPEEETGEPVAVLIRRIALEEGEIDVADRSLATPFETHLGPISFEVHDFGTRPADTAEQRFKMRTESGATLEWTGTFGISPVRSTGHVAAKGEHLRLLWRYLQDRVGFEVTDGTASVGLDYDLALETSGPRMEVSDLKLTLKDLAVRPRGEKAEVLRLPRLEATGGRFDLGRRVAHLGELHLNGVRLDVRRDEAGTVDLLRLLEAPAAGATAPAPPVAEAASAEEAPEAGDSAATGGEGPAEESSEGPEEGEETAAGEASAPADVEWVFSLDRFLLEDFGLALEDRSTGTTLQTGLEQTRLEVGNISTKPGALFGVDLTTTITTGGRVATRGQVGIAPPAADLQVNVEELSLLFAQPFLASVAHLQLDSAKLSIDGQAGSGSDEAFAFDGRVELADFSTTDSLTEERFLAWKSLVLSDLAVRLDGRSVEVPEIDFEAPYARFLIAKDGSTNVGDVFSGGDAGGEEGDAGGVEADAVDAGVAGGETPKPFSIAIGKINVRQGSANFGDFSLPLPFETGIVGLRGDISTIRSESTKPAKVKLRGTVAKYGEARIEGKFAPFDPLQFVDVNVIFRNIDMSSLTPYSAKFAGYEIAGGKLTLDLHYELNSGALEAGNSIVLDQFELGDKVDSADAIDVPLRLAVALLKDSNGVIDLDVPVSGNVDDPQFSYGKALRDTLKGIIVRAVKAPFSMLGSLVGASDGKLNQVLFNPGIAELAPPEREKLAKLAEALAKRPQLSIDVKGRYAEKTDGQALRIARVDAIVDERVAGKRDEDEARREELEDLFRDEFSRTELENLEAANTRIVEPTLRTGGAKAQARLDVDDYLAALTARLADKQTVGEDELEALAGERARAIADFLAEAGVAAERVHVLASERTKKIVDGRIRLKLEMSKDGGRANAQARVAVPQ